MRKIVVGMIVVCLILSALQYQPVRAADLYVDDTGTDSGNCQNPATPCRTIQYAVNQAGTGDTIHVAAGTYRFTLTSEVPPIVINKSVTLQGAGAGVTIYNASTPPANPKDGIQVTGSVVVNIRGFTVTGARNVGIHYLNGASGEIAENEIYQNGKEGIRVAASFPGGSGNPSHPTISHNDIYENGCTEGYDGVHFLQGSYGTIDDNDIYENCDDGIFIDDSGDSEVIISDNYIRANDGDGIDLHDSTVTINDDNDIYDNGSDGIETDDSTVTIEDNEIYENDDDGIDGEDSTLTINDNSINENGSEEEGDGMEIDDSVCTIVGNGVGENDDDGIDVDDSSCTIRANWSHGNGSDGIEISYGGGEAAMPSPLMDEQRNDEDETEEDGEESGRNVLQQNGEEEYIIVNNVLYDNEDDGIDMYGNEVVRIIITNNTIAYNSEGESSDGIYHGGPSSPEITNNIITFNGDDGIDDQSEDTTVNTYNDVFGNGDEDYAGDATAGVGSISADPLFLDEEEEDFRLPCNSPAVNAGNNGAPEIPETDIEENPRIVCIVDMGAYEANCPCKKAQPESLQVHLSSLLPTAQNNISKGRDLVTQMEDLLSQAEEKGLDTAQCEKLIDEAKGLLEKAKKSLTNPIYANNLALQAIEKLKDAIDCLKALLG